MSSDPQAALRPQAQSRTVRARLDDLARRYYVPLASFFRKRTHSAPEVQDLVQQVFLCLAQYRELGDIEKPDGYIFQTAANKLNDHYALRFTHRTSKSHFKMHFGTQIGSVGTQAEDRDERAAIKSIGLSVEVLFSVGTRPGLDALFANRCFSEVRTRTNRLIGIKPGPLRPHVAKVITARSIDRAVMAAYRAQ
jgi:hypothetical protein